MQEKSADSNYITDQHRHDHNLILVCTVTIGGEESQCYKLNLLSANHLVTVKLLGQYSH